MNTRLEAHQRDALKGLLREDEWLWDDAAWSYGSDNSRLHAPPWAVALPRSTESLPALVAWCAEQRVPLVVRGRGTNTVGATVPVAGGIVLSTERLRRILSIDCENRVAVVEPGVLNGDLQQQLASKGFFWAPDPSSAPYSSIGGNLGCNAAGPRAVKYGSCRENTLGLQFIDGRGRLIRTGVYTTKGVVGYDLTRLLVGSEGTLGVILQASLRLLPLPAARSMLAARYDCASNAAKAVSRVMAQAATPCALEFMDAGALQLARRREPEIPEAGALLLIELDGASATETAAAQQAVGTALQGPGLLGMDQAEDAAQRERLWAARKALSPALRELAPKKINEDVVVPVSQLGKLIEGLEQLGQRHQIPIVNFGHAGNGNVHVNLLVDPDEPGQAQAWRTCLAQVFELVLELGGTLSGEHGVGIEKRSYIAAELGEDALDLMRGIQRVFDPHGILNPGKTLP